MIKVETPYHAILGRKRITEICKKEGLSPKDDLIVDQILLNLHFEGGDYRNISKGVDSSLLKGRLRAGWIRKVCFSIIYEVGEKTREKLKRKSR